jgi:hypothetical protein
LRHARGHRLGDSTMSHTIQSSGLAATTGSHRRAGVRPGPCRARAAAAGRCRSRSRAGRCVRAPTSNRRRRRRGPPRACPTAASRAPLRRA